MKLLRQSHLASSLVVSFLVLGASAQQRSSSLPNLLTATQATNTANTNTAKTTAAAAQTSATGKPTTAAVITGSGSSAATSASIPAISGTSATGDGALTGLPTLTGGFVIVAPSVPPTANAPYMQTSKLPEGTVFIAVGAILGFLAMSVLLWRGLVAWSLHRSVKRAALHQNMSDTKALFRTPAAPAPFYKYSDRDSTISLSGLGHKGGKKGGRPITSQAGASTGNLFFSPTAGAAGAGLANPGNRGSNYLPAGYYAAGASAPGNGSGHVSLGGPGISLANLGPQSQGYSRAKSVGPSPPDSPRIHAEGGRPHMASSSTLNLNQGYGGSERAPSAFLDDLFDGENAPPVPTHQRHHSASPRRFN